MAKAKYNEIYHDLKEKIENGQYNYADMLPSENELTQVYDCSRNTLRRALALLTREGYTQPIHGRGVRVIYTPHKQHDFILNSSIEGLYQIATKSGFKVTNQVLTFTEIIADERLSKKQILKWGQNCILSSDCVPLMTFLRWWIIRCSERV